MALGVTRRDWTPILDRAAEIVASYDTGVTLRQLFYRLVSAELIRNTQPDYTQLSARTAAARRAGTFPALIDRTRRVHRWESWPTADAAVQELIDVFRIDRARNQEWAIYIGVEKNGLVNQLQHWFGDLGVPIIAVGGYSSQTYVDDIRDEIEDDGRPAVLIYGGDFDASGEDIERDLIGRIGVFDTVKRVALNLEQVQRYQLPPQPGKKKDTRAAGFAEKYGSLMQVELDALEPNVLKGLYQEALAEFFDSTSLAAALAAEQDQRERLRKMLGAS
jgi:hypothetical protein